MKAEELRRRVWISDGIDHEFQVGNIYEEHVDELMWPELGKIEISKCEGIPLTEEWLEKLGFIRERDILGLWDTWWNKGLGLNHVIDNRFSVKTPYKTEIVLLVHEVHELQNLFYALNKTELEVK